MGAQKETLHERFGIPFESASGEEESDTRRTDVLYPLPHDGPRARLGGADVDGGVRCMSDPIVHVTNVDAGSDTTVSLGYVFHLNVGVVDQRLDRLEMLTERALFHHRLTQQV